MKRSNKKGFTIVELVIVIAIIAVLAAVLIPTFAGVIRKANIANDTAVAKNLNTAAVAAQATDFDAALSAVKDAGYLVANLNAKAKDCYFVWENDTKQFLLYDLKEKAIIYSNTDVAGDPDDSWCFAVNNPTDEAEVKSVWNSVTLKTLLVDIDDLSAVLAAGGNIYMDESVILDKNHLFVFDAEGKTAVINLEKSSLNTAGILPDDGANVVPVEVKKGNITFNGGYISTAGANRNAHDLPIAIALRTREGTNVSFVGTTFENRANNGQIKIGGTATMKDVVISSTKYGVETFFNGKLTLTNVTIDAKGLGVCVWACNYNHSEFATDAGKTHSGTSLITIESGSYKSHGTTGNNAAIVSCGGDITITGGDFNAVDDRMFAFGTDSDVAGDVATITIKGGTFNGKAFAELSVEYLQDLCVNGTVSYENGVYTIVK